MPRIDPSQLLRTLSVLLAKDGGIRSAEEVPRIVQLMQKFSKKLVSKCIYIHILCSSSPELLESFLSQKGWDLLNSWFSDAIKNQNYYLCGDLVKLFAVCPMNSARLKENVEINQAPKLIRQLSCDTRIEESVRTLALQVLQQWMSVIRTPQNLQVSNTVSPTVSTNGKIASETSDHPVKVSSPQVQQLNAPKVVSKQKVSPTKKQSPSKRHNVIDSSDSENNFDDDDSKDYNPSGSDLENGKAFHPAVKKLKKDTSKDDSTTDVDDLLGGDSTSEDEKRAKSKDDKSKKDSVVSESSIKKNKEDREKERERRDKEREREREERKRKERERERRKAQERKDKAKPYSRSELRTSLDSSDKERIKEVAKKMKEESGTSITAGLGRIPKIVKPGMDDKKKNGASFGDLLGGLDDVKKIKPKAPPIKNKNKDLLESINNPSPLKPKHKLDTKSADEMLKKVKDKDKERRNSLSKPSEGEKKPKVENVDLKEEKKSKSVNTESKEDKRSKGDGIGKLEEPTEKEKSSDKPKPKVIIPEKTAEKRSHNVASPKVETKKSPSVIKESSFFGDVLGDIMKEPPRKKKRRPSDVKPVSEKESKELNEKAKETEVIEKESSPEEKEEEKMDTIEKSDDLAFAEPTSELPREVRGILVYVKGNKPKKKIQWRPEDKLVEIEYFEMDETERANVWKMKTFEEMKKKEAELEKGKWQSGAGKMNMDEDVEEAPKVWKLILLKFEGEVLEGISKIWETQGSQSAEKAVQEQRELRVLRSLYFNQIPSDPTEPDPGSNDKTGEECKEIPPLDLSDNKDDSSYDYSNENWPVPSLQSQQPPPPISTNSLNALLKDINPNLLASLPPPNIPPPQIPPPLLNPADAKLFAAQQAAAEALGGALPLPLPTPQPGMGGAPPNNGYQGFQAGYHDRGSQRGHNNYERGFKGGHSNSYHNHNHNNHHYNKNYKNRDDRDYRDDHRDRERDRDRDRGYRDKNDYKKPCRFWMERGKCRDGDRCVYPHPSR